MTTWNKTFALYIDVDALADSNCLLSGKSSTARTVQPFYIQGDKFIQQLFFRRKATSDLSASTAMELLAGSNIIIAAKSADALDVSTLLFSATDFTLSGSGDDVCYAATLDLNTQEIAAAFDAASATTLNIKVDVEIQNVGNTDRCTFQFNAVLKQQVYGGESNPAPGTPVYPLPQDLVLKAENGALWRFPGGVPHQYIVATNKWYPLVISIIDGIPVVAAGEGVVL